MPLGGHAPVYANHWRMARATGAGVGEVLAGVRPSVRGVIGGYGFAALTAAACLVFRILLTPVLHDIPTLVVFMPAVMASAAIGGLGPALLAAVGSLAGLFVALTPAADRAASTLVD